MTDRIGPHIGQRIVRIATQGGRTLLLLALVCVGTVLLTRLAPGYAVDLAELDGAHSVAARAGEQELLRREGTAMEAAGRTLLSLAHGQLGVSRQYGMPVGELVRLRLLRSARLLLAGMASGWLLALTGALLCLGPRIAGSLSSLLFPLLLALPAGVLGTFCLLRNTGGPVLVLALVVAARDFQFLDRLLRDGWTSAPLIQARSAGLSTPELLRVHLLPAILGQLRAVVTISVVAALGALLPVEVLFDTGGVAQLAWTAASNRDLPVLLAVTLLVAVAVAASGLAVAPAEEPA